MNAVLFNFTTTIVLLTCFFSHLSAGKQEFSIPLNVGVGPEFNYYNGVIGKDQAIHYGIKIDMHAFIDKTVLEKNKNKIPKKFRKQVQKLSSVKIGKVYIPESIIFSPKIKNTGIYGINFRPVGAGLGLVSGAFLDVNLNLGLNLSYLFIHSDKLFEDEKGTVMHFLRPGLNAKLNFQFKFSRIFQLSSGFEGIGYVPQEMSVDSKIFEIGDFNNDNLWLMGQIYLMMNIRIPMMIKM
ncbi:MAG: hypothetical protein HQK83_01800 [Fibrobacteria bacterium]|nr:hypothetical protein [Fibrobacteria bacterium]